MRTWLSLALLTLLSIETPCLFAQKKLVVMGSSTAAGTGSSSYATSWVGRVFFYYNKNMGDGVDTTVINLALGGYTSYLEMPTGFTPPPGRPLPDPGANVTKALSYNPDVIIINLPTNDVVLGYTKKEFMNNLRLMYSTITATSGPGGVATKCYITTSQPRTLSTDLRDSLRTLVDSINNNFGQRAINFWSDLVTADGTYDIKPEVSAGDGIHINDIGHNYVFIRTRDKNIFNPLIVLPLTLTDFQAAIVNNSVKLSWHTEQEEPNTFFDIQRSTDGLNYELLDRVTAQGNGLPNSYTWTDFHPLANKTFYRLKISEGSREKYSKIASVVRKGAQLSINKLHTENSSATLVADITIQNSQTAIIRIINMTGSVVYQQSRFINTPSSILQLPIEKLQAGQYFLSVRTMDNNTAVMGFIK